MTTDYEGPNPFEGDTRGLSDREAARGAWAALQRFRNGEISDAVLRRTEGDTWRDKENLLAYWLWRHHHDGNSKRKVIGQRYWTPGATRSLHQHWPPVPTKRIFGADALVSEHVVPKAVMKPLLLEAESLADVERLFGLNLCAVVARSENKRLSQKTHPDPFDPWLRYSVAGLRLVPNPDWSAEEWSVLKRHGLVEEGYEGP